MIQFTIETEIERPVAEIFAFTDPGRLATWQSNTLTAVQEGDGSPGLGTCIREVSSRTSLPPERPPIAERDRSSP